MYSSSRDNATELRLGDSEIKLHELQKVLNDVDVYDSLY